MEQQNKPYQILDGFQLKILGLLLMVVDHIHQMFENQGAPEIMTIIGRVVLPIFLFMLAEGFHYTSNRKKYAIRLYIFSLIMGFGNMIIQNIFVNQEVMLTNNIFATMFLAIVYMWLIDNIKDGIKEKKLKKVILNALGLLLPIVAVYPTMLVMQYFPQGVVYILALLPSVLTVEGGFMAIILAVLFYLLRPYGRIVQIIPLIVINLLNVFLGEGIQAYAIFAFIPILLYNGKPGRKSKWLFYIFYPAHIWILYILAYFMK